MRISDWSSDVCSSNLAGLRKRYLALLAGRMPDGVMSVDAPLHVGLRQGGERHVQVNDGGKASLSHFRALEQRGGHSYRSEARRVGEEGVSKCRSWGAPGH